MMRRIISFIAATLLLLNGPSLFAQQALPEFSAIIKPGNRIVISWTNNYTNTKQINIQRSADSLKNFKTIVTIPDPANPENGFVDTKAPYGRIYYRLFITMNDGKYLFTRSRKPSRDSAKIAREEIMSGSQRVMVSDHMSARELNILKEKLDPGPTENFFVVKLPYGNRTLSEEQLSDFRDSIVNNTSDTLLFQSVDVVVIKPFAPKDVHRSSRYVYTEKFGNVMIDLPDAERKKYSVSFFEDDMSPLFEVEKVRSTSLIVDKTNFVHAGWFWFELFENGKLVERRRFYLPKDF